VYWKLPTHETAVIITNEAVSNMNKYDAEFKKEIAQFLEAAIIVGFRKIGQDGRTKTS